MTHTLRRPILSAVCVLATAQVAHADISADDVWSNLEAYVSAFGGTLSGSMEQSGDTATVSGLEASFTLPFDIGTVQITQNEFSMREAGDGTVDIIYPDEISYGFVADIKEEGVFSGTFLMGHTNMITKVSGEPGNITYDYAADAITGKLGEISMPEMDDVGALEATIDLQIQGLSGNSTITEGAVLKTIGELAMGQQSFKMDWTMKDGDSVMSGTSETSVESGTSKAVLNIPTENVDIMNLAAAITSGLMLQAETTTKGYKSSQVQTLDGQQLMQQSTGQATADTVLSLDETGVKVSGIGTDFFVDFLIPEALPLPIRLDGDKVTAKLEMPLAADEAPQPYALGMSMEGVIISDQIWSMFDPTAALPRDPALIDLDLSGTLRNKMDLLDFNALAASGGADLPVEPLSADINSLTIKAAGVELDATGALTFDNEDTAAYGGMPKPVGQVGATLKGANGLMETLVSMGLMSEQDVAGARMGIAMVARPEGNPEDDILSSQFVFGEDGSISANGMQLK